MKRSALLFTVLLLLPAAAGTAPPSSSAQPSPQRQSPMWASGARSPLAPREPCSGTAGTTPAFSIAARASTSSARTPESPAARVLTRIAIIPRPTSGSRKGPTPAAWLRSRECCSARLSPGGMLVSASAPKPVLTP